MRFFLRHRVVTIAALSALVGVAMCVPDLDTTRTPSPDEGTVGEEVFRVVCERVDVGEAPDDVDFRRAKSLCAPNVATRTDGGVADASHTDASADAGTTMALAGPKVRALVARRSAIANAIDHTVPMSIHVATDALLVQLLPLYGPDNGNVTTASDGGTVTLADGGHAPAEDALLPASTNAMARLLNGIGNNNDATSALARLSLHQGYRPPSVALGLTRSLLGYSQIGSVLEHTFGLIRQPSSTGSAGAAWPQWSVMLDMLRGEFARSEPASVSDQMHGTTLDAAIDLIFRTDSALGTGRERLLVRRDPFGMARVDTGTTGSLSAPFVDVDPVDGFADSLDGHFVDNHRVAFTTPSPFPANEAPDGPRDDAGRIVIQGTSSPLFQYVDLDQTVLSALLHDSATLVDPVNNTALRFANGAGVLLGTRTQTTHDYMIQHPCPSAGHPDAMCNVPPSTYRAFDATQGPAPLVDMVHAVGTLLTSADIDRILSTFQSLFADHEEPLARNMGAILAINEIAKAHPEARMDETSVIWDDMMDAARQVAQEPGLIEDVLNAARDTRTGDLGAIFGAYADYRDRVEPNWSDRTTTNTPLTSMTVSSHVDRTQPDTQDPNHGPMDNRSIFERFLHLIHDLDGVELCNKPHASITVTALGIPFSLGDYARCDLFRIPDAAVFYLQSIAGTAHIDLHATGLVGFLNSIPGLGGTTDSIIQDQSEIDGFTTNPTSIALNRLVFEPDSRRTRFVNDLMDPVVTRDGLQVRDLHGGTLFALELFDLYNKIRPLVNAFNTHANGNHLFVQLLGALWNHYPTHNAGQFQSTNPNSPLYNTMDGAQTYEAILAHAFASDLLPAMTDLTSTLPSIDAGGGRTGIDALASVARALLDPNALTNITYRDGRTTALRSDGTTVVAQPSLFYLFADAINGIEVAFQNNSAQHDDWITARSSLVDTFLAVDSAGTNTAQFHNRRIPLVSNLAIQWIRDRVAAHTALGDEDPWARGLSNRLSDTVHGPSFSATYDLLMAFYNDAPTRTSVGGLLASLLDDSDNGPNNHFGVALTAIGDTVQTLRDDTDIDPLLHALAPGFQRAVPGQGGATIEEETVPIAVRLLDRIRTYDSSHVLDSLMGNLVARQPTPALADEPIVVLGDAIAETHRIHPGIGGPLRGDDFREVFSQVSDFFTDGSRGMEQFYFIVQHRRY